MTHVPSAQEVRTVERATLGQPHIDIAVWEGCRLSQLRNQDAYRYVLGKAYVGGSCEDEVLARYRRCVEGLQFAFSDAADISQAAG